MNQLNWVYAIGEINPEFVDEAKEEEHLSTGTLSFPNKKKTIGIKRVAMIFLAAAVSVFGLLMLNENVRAAVTRSIVRFFDDGVRISFRDPDDTGNENGERKTTYDVTFGYIPEGLTLNEMHDDEHPNYR